MVYFIRHRFGFSCVLVIFVFLLFLCSCHFVFFLFLCSFYSCGFVILMLLYFCYSCILEFLCTCYFCILFILAFFSFLCSCHSCALFILVFLSFLCSFFLFLIVVVAVVEVGRWLKTLFVAAVVDVKVDCIAVGRAVCLLSVQIYTEHDSSQTASNSHIIKKLPITIQLNSFQQNHIIKPMIKVLHYVH